MIPTAVDPAFASHEFPGEGFDWPATMRAAGEAAQQIVRLSISNDAPLVELCSHKPMHLKAFLDGGPEIFRNDAEVRRLNGDDVAGRSTVPLLGPVSFDLLEFAPDDPADVQGTQQNLTNGGRRPALGVPRGSDSFRVQRLRDPRHAQSLVEHVEDPAHDSRLVLVDDAEHMQSTAVRRLNFLVVVPEHFSTGHVAGLRLSQHRVIGPLLRAFTFHFGRKVGEGEHDLIHCGFKCTLPILEIKEHAHPGIGDLLQRDPLATAR